MQLLLANKANVDARNGEHGNALQAASLDGCTEIVKWLLANDAEERTGWQLRQRSSAERAGVVTKYPEARRRIRN